ncbi:MAG: fatty acid desaturase [Cyanobacteria bacterium]|nr:fatty acid desaturase [Cyanobacteriota bacterium]
MEQQKELDSQEKASSQVLPKNRYEFLYVLPFLFLHLGCVAVIWVGWSWTAVALAVALYWVRMFAITGFYHRYFSHKTFKTHRWTQLIFALWGMTAVQRGPLWWAAHHRNHHRTSDKPQDVHSPIQHGLLWSQIGWMTCQRNMETDYSLVKDLAAFPELMFLNKNDWIIPTAYGLGLLGIGAVVNHFFPQLHTSGPQFLVWGFFVSTIALFHMTSTINSLAHQLGSRRYNTPDGSRNNWFLAIFTLGEGWHNNHHQYQGTVRLGFSWWEYDVTFYILKAMSFVGLVYDLKPIPKAAFQKRNLAD